MHFNLLPLHWNSEGVSLNKSVHGPFERNCLGLQKFLSSTVLIPTEFYSQKLWRLIVLALELWAWGPGFGLGPLAPQVSLPIFICHTWVWDQLVLSL